MYRVVRQLKRGLKVIEIYLQYQENKAKCGRKEIRLPTSEKEYIKKKVLEGWTLDNIIGRNEKRISCGMRTLYRKFKSG